MMYEQRSEIDKFVRANAMTENGVLHTIHVAYATQMEIKIICM